MDALARHGADVSSPETPARLARVRTFHTLDALRGIAALVVVLFHTSFIYAIARPAEGQIAVDLFFVISGFIIAHRYGDRSRAMSLRRFIKVRLIRLYPLCLLGTVLGVVPIIIAMAAGHDDAVHRGLVASFPLALLMMPSPFALPEVGELYPLNYVVWSLALEIIVNVAYAAGMRFWTPHRLAALLAVAFVMLCACTWSYGTLNGGFEWSNVPIGVPRAVYGFAMGVLIHHLYKEKRLRWSAPWWLLLLVSAAIFFYDPPYAKALWELLLVAFVAPMIVAAAVGSEPPRSAEGACALVGVFSYVVYSLHMPLVGLLLRGEDVLKFNSHKQTWQAAVLFTVLLALVCVVAHYTYDRPVRRLLTRSLLADGVAAS